MVGEWTKVSQVPILESKVKTVTRGIHYKFAILNSLKINTLWEKLSPIPLGISKFDETYRFRKRRSKSPIGSIFRLKGTKISDLHQVEGQTTKESPNQGFQRCIFLLCISFYYKIHLG